MKLFISWSGERSGRVAAALQAWLPGVIQFTSAWTSSASIDAGARWSTEVASALEQTQLGIICLTPENIESPWILFEAGALSKAVTQSLVIPYLLGFESRQLKGPLAQFQAVTADQDGTFRLVRSINSAAVDRRLSDQMLEDTFDLWWPRLDESLQVVRAITPVGVKVPKRTAEDMLGEVLELLRAHIAATNIDPPTVIAPTISTVAQHARRLTAAIRHLRNVLNLTQVEFAQKIQEAAGTVTGPHPSTIARWEAGTTLPSSEYIAVLDGIAKAVGLPGLFVRFRAEQENPSE